MLFNYSMPVKVYFGRNVVEKNKKVFDSLGRRAFIITGKHSSKKNGSLDDVISALKDVDIDYVIFDEVEENPSLETIERAVEIGKAKKIDFIIGIGGGSPMDAAKAVGIFIRNEEYSKDNIFDAPKLKSIPIAAVPTTSGTGSEVTQHAVVTDNKARTKRNLGQIIFPKVAFIDPGYTMELPDTVTISTAVDAFSHLAEGYLNTNANFLSDMFAEKGFKLFYECINMLIEREFDYETREKLMLVSTLGGFVIAQTGTSLPHGMGYPLTYFKGVSHGMANGVLFVEYLKSFKNADKVNKMLSLMNFSSIDEFKKVMKKLINVNIDISEEEMTKYAKSISENRNKLKNHTEQIGFSEIYQIYAKSLL